MERGYEMKRIQDQKVALLQFFLDPEACAEDSAVIYCQDSTIAIDATGMKLLALIRQKRAEELIEEGKELKQQAKTASHTANDEHVGVHDAESVYRLAARNGKELSARDKQLVLANLEMLKKLEHKDSKQNL